VAATAFFIGLDRYLYTGIVALFKPANPTPATLRALDGAGASTLNARMTFQTNTVEKWPNFFIVGAPRAGTTSLYYYLRNVPGVYLPPLKELHYFAVTLRSLMDRQPVRAPGRVPIREKSEYLNLYRGVKDEVAVGDASALYLWDPAAAGLIHAVAPQARIIISLRDPAERAFSHYLMHVRDGAERLPFREVVESPVYIDPGLYAAQVKRYLEIFGRQHVKILIFEEFIRDTKAAVNDVLEFLGVDYRVSKGLDKPHNTFALPRSDFLIRVAKSRAARIVLETLVPAAVRRFGREKILFHRPEKPRMHDACRKVLEERYRNDVKDLEEILGRPLPWTLAWERRDPSSA
jgi:hypothetical protein